MATGKVSGNKDLYFVQYSGDMQGTKIVRAIKDYCWDNLSGHLCTERGVVYIYGLVVEMESKLKEQWPTAKLPAIEYVQSGKRIQFKSDSATDNSQLLSFSRVKGIELGPDEDGFVIERKEE